MKPYWIKERHNPQLGVYYHGCGRLSVRDARKQENSIYGTNVMIRCDSEEEYNNKLAELAKKNKIV